MTTTLTQEEKRVKIAEVCKFVRKKLNREYYWIGSRRHEIRFDPFNDLNACHEMEKSLDGREQDYNRELHKALGTAGGIGSGIISEWEYHATAAQRAEAFGKTLNLW